MSTIVRWGDVLVEGLLHRGDVTVLYERLGHVGPPDGAAAGDALHLLPGNVQAHLSQPIHYPLAALAAGHAQLMEGLLQRRVVGVQEVAQHVHLGARDVGTQLDPWDESEVLILFAGAARLAKV